MIRYLRVVGVDDPYDAACEGWITVVRGLPGFKGDETAWRVWLLACVRMRAEEGSLRRSWGSAGSASGGPTPDEIQVDSLDDADEQDPESRGVNDTIAAIRDLPLGQGEIVMLRLAAELPVGAVADIVGADAAAVRRAESRGIERLGADRELVVWSLAAPPMPAELADERVALGAFRSMPKSSRQSAPRATILTLGTSLDKRPGRGEPGDAQVVSINQPLTRNGERAGRTARAGVTVNGHALASVSPLPATRASRRAAARTSTGGAGARTAVRPGPDVLWAGRSRAAVIGIVAASASVMSLSGISAAAFVGVLPDGPQQVMHDLLGAPAPTRSGNADGTDATGGTGGTAGRTGDGTGGTSPGTRSGHTPVGPAATSSAARGLCQAWSVDKAEGIARDKSVAFRNLAAAAGGPDQVDAYCRVATTPAPAPTKTPNAHAPTAKPTKTPPAHPSPTPHRTNPNSPTKTSKTAVPNSPSKTSKAANPNSPTSGSKGGAQRTTTSSTQSSPGAVQQSAPDVASTAPTSLDAVSKSSKGARGTGSPAR
jgi:DNA-directed RNA polymerase specialized sigma24 family protein